MDKRTREIMAAARKVRACRNAAADDGELVHFEVDFIGSCGPTLSQGNMREVLEYLSSDYDEYVGERINSLEILCYTMTEDKAEDYYMNGGQWTYHLPERL